MNFILNRSSLIGQAIKQSALRIKFKNELLSFQNKSFSTVYCLLSSTQLRPALLLSSKQQLYNNGHLIFSTRTNSQHSESRSTNSQNQEDDIKNPLFNLDENDKAREEEKERSRKRQVWWTKFTFYLICGAFTGAAIWAVIEFGLPKKDEQGNVIVDQFSDYSQPKQTIYRTWFQLLNIQEDLKAPSRELLLPPPLTYPYMQPPYTLVLELKDLLVFFDWDYQSGWGVKTRPYLKKFFEQTGPPLFEIVIFTEVPPLTALPILEGIDKDGFIMHRLFKDSTRFIKGKYVKDLNGLNRDLSKVIQIEVDREACSLNPRNCLVLEKWKGDESDTALIDLAIFLRTIASQKVEDVRDVISHYSQFDKPLEVFRQNQLHYIEEEERRKKSQPLASLVKKKI